MVCIWSSSLVVQLLWHFVDFNRKYTFAQTVYRIIRWNTCCVLWISIVIIIQYNMLFPIHRSNCVWSSSYVFWFGGARTKKVLKNIDISSFFKCKQLKAKCLHFWEGLAMFAVIYWLQWAWYNLILCTVVPVCISRFFFSNCL